MLVAERAAFSCADASAFAAAEPMPTAAIHVYDLSQGMARAMSMAIVGKQVDIIPHTGIVVNWPSGAAVEYFFGGGICTSPAGQSMPMPACEVIPLGEIAKTEAELTQFLAQLSPRYTAATYDLLKHNCNHFSNEVALFLTGGATAVPARIVNVADEALSTPQGAQLRGMLDGMQSQFNANNAGNRFNPLGHVSSAQFAAPAPTAPTAPTAPVAASATPAAAPPAPGGEDESPLNLAELRAAIVEVDKAEVEARRACLSTVTKLGGNIVENPDDPKYRRVKMSNGAFAKKVAACSGGTELMMALGFLPEEVWAPTCRCTRYLY